MVGNLASFQLAAILDARQAGLEIQVTRVVIVSSTVTTRPSLSTTPNALRASVDNSPQCTTMLNETSSIVCSLPLPRFSAFLHSQMSNNELLYTAIGLTPVNSTFVWTDNTPYNYNSFACQFLVSIRIHLSAWS